MAKNFSKLKSILSSARLDDKALYEFLNNFIDTAQETAAILDKKLNISDLIDLTKQVKNKLHWRNGGALTHFYTPTLTDTANITASVLFGPVIYWRVGDYITVSGKVTIDPTVVTTLTQLELTLPFQTFFESENQCSGVVGGISLSTTQSFGGIVRANTTDHRAVIEFYSVNIVPNDVRFYFTYQVIQKP
jgi:hypothetical protein